MRILKTLLLALLGIVAVIGGIFVTAVAAVTTVVVIVGRRLLSRRSRPLAPPELTRHGSAPRPAEAIEITATEIPENR
ncbi:MAG TPA: hypothetical protein VEQ65_02630 [Opitutus sp.]|nr:hypothetical protein [Opitutus sp.]